jgi:membrane peptidoglycan carboxypeptidase
MYLLAFDTNAARHAIMACGDPDTATTLWLGYNAPQMSASTGALAVRFTVNATGGSGPMEQHGEYFDDKTNNLNGDQGDPSHINIGYIISGQTDRVQLVHSAQPLPARTDPLPAPGTTATPRTAPATPAPVPQVSPAPPTH